MQAVMTTLGALPLVFSRAAKAFKRGLDLMPDTAAMYKAVRTLARPPRMERWPLALFIRFSGTTRPSDSPETRVCDAWSWTFSHRSTLRGPLATDANVEASGVSRFPC